MTKPNWREIDIRFYAVLASLFISVFFIVFPFGHMPNDDAYIYIRTADIFLNQGLAAAYQHYAWASYSILIALISKFGFELITAAYLLNALFFALLVYSYMSIVREINPSRLLTALAAIVILVYPQLNEYRHYIIRDIGFWALALFALWQLLLYTRSGQSRFAIGFCVGLLLATMLRPEGLIYLLVTPFSILFNQGAEPVLCRRRFSRLAGLIVGIGLLSIMLSAMFGVNLIGLLIEFVSVYKPFIINTFNPDPAQANTIGIALFGEHAAAYSQEYIAFFMAAGLLAILVANLINGIGGPYLLVLIYGIIQKQIRVRREVAAPIVSFMLTNLIVLLGFLFITRYLASRYTIPFSLMLALLVPSIIAHYWQSKPAEKRRTASVIIGLLLTYCTLDAYVSFGHSKQYVVDAIDWINNNSSASTALITNNQPIAYYSGKVENYDHIMRNLAATDILQTSNGDLVALEMRYATEQLLLQPAIIANFEQVLALPDSSDAHIVILRRINAR